MSEPEITQDIIAAHGLSDSEYQTILDLMGRTPSLHRIRHLLCDVERALFVQVFQEMAAHPAR